MARQTRAPQRGPARRSAAQRSAARRSAAQRSATQRVRARGMASRAFLCREREGDASGRSVVQWRRRPGPTVRNRKFQTAGYVHSPALISRHFYRTAGSMETTSVTRIARLDARASRLFVILERSSRSRDFAYPRLPLREHPDATPARDATEILRRPVSGKCIGR